MEFQIANGASNSYIDPFPGSGGTLDQVASPLLLYSTVSWLSFAISEEYYAGKHFAWCTPHFDLHSLPKFVPGVPPTSCPKEIYLSLAEEVVRGDRHSSKIDQLRHGIIRGADIKFKAGVITATQTTDIKEIAVHAEIRDFKPLVYIIPYNLVATKLQEVPVDKRAHFLSPEFMIDDMDRNTFDVIDFAR